MIIVFAHQVPPHWKQSDPRAIFIPVGYKGNLREKNSLFLRTRRFKDYFHVRPSAFRWWKDTRFNQVNATTLHLCSPELRVHTPRVRVREHRSGWLLWTLHTLETVPPRANRNLKPQAASYEHVSRRLVRRKMRTQFGNRLFDIFHERFRWFSDYSVTMAISDV